MKFANFRKSLTLVLTLVMAMVLTVPALAANPFTDVAAGAYYYDAVQWALEEGVTTGVTANQFQPTGSCTRGQVVTFLWRAKGKPEPSVSNPFKDVSESSPFYKAILWAYENGITTGVTADTFNPNGVCSSAHVVTFLWRANGEPFATKASTLAAAYPDSAYYKDAVAWADTNGLLSGVGKDFQPNSVSPRADIVTYLYRDKSNMVIYQLDATPTSHTDGTVGTNTSYKWLKYFDEGVLTAETWSDGVALPLSNFHNSRTRLPAGENLWVAFDRFDAIDTKYFDDVTITFSYVQNLERGSSGDMKVQDYGPEFFVSGDNGATWSQAAGTMAYASAGTRVTFQESADKLQEAYQYEITSTNLVKLANGGKITNIRVYPYGTKSEDCRCGFSLASVQIMGKLKDGVSLDDIPSGYDPGVNLGNPWAKDASLASYEIYSYAPEGSAYTAKGEDLTINSTRGWIYNGTLNGGTTKVPHLAIYNNTSNDGGLSGGETLELDLRSIPNIDTNVFKAANLTFQYVYGPENSDLNVEFVDQLQVLVSTDNGRTWSAKKAGLRSQEWLGSVATSNGLTQTALYEVTTEDIIGLVADGAVITDVVLKPFGEYKNYWGCFRLVNLTVDGYKTALPAYTEKKEETIKVDEATLRQIVVNEAKKVADFEWTSDKDIDTNNWTGSANVSSAVPMKYFGGYLHKGPVYTRNAISSSEMWMATYENGKHTSGYTDTTAIGMDCTCFTFNAFSRISDNYAWNGRVMAPDVENMPLVAPLNNETREVNNALILTRFTKEQVYQHYANAKPGDVADTVGAFAHARLVSGTPKVVYNADGTINPDKSTIAMTEAGGSVRYYWQKADGTEFYTTGNPADHAKANPTDKFLYGRSALVDENYTFTALYKNYYVIHSPIEYKNGAVAKLNIETKTEITPANVVSKGLTVGMRSNYRMIAIEAKIFKGTTEVFSDYDYQGMRTIVLNYNNAELNSAIRKLGAGTYKVVLDVTAGPVTTVGGEVPVTRVLEMEFTTDGSLANAGEPLTITEDSFSGFDLGFSQSGEYLCFRFAKPADTTWNTQPVAYDFVLKDSKGTVIAQASQMASTIGFGSSSTQHQIGMSKAVMKNGYTIESVKGLTDCSLTLNVTDGKTKYSLVAEGLEIYKSKEIVVPDKSGKLNITKGSFSGADLGFNASGQYFCVRIDRPEGTNWSENAPYSYTVVVKTSAGKEICRTAIEGTAVGYGPSSKIHQIGMSKSVFKNGYTLDSIKGMTGVSVDITLVDSVATWTASATGLTISK